MVTLGLLEQFQEIAKKTGQGLPAALYFTADKKQYIRNFRAPERLILLGGGNIAQPLCQYAADLGFQVIVADDRPSFANAVRFPQASEIICDTFPAAIAKIGIQETDYVAVITRGHRYDADCLRTILQGEKMPYYLGMIGSKRRAAELLRLLEEEGISHQKLEKICTPIGISIGALTVQEIAVSIVAQLIKYRRKNTNRRSRNQILTAEDVDPKLLQFMIDETIPKAFIIVCETRGSTPVKSGAYMAVDQNFRPFGTIGGGCSENAIMLQAYQMIDTCDQKTVTVQLGNSAAAEEGMVCGGEMDVYMTDFYPKM